MPSTKPWGSIAVTFMYLNLYCRIGLFPKHSDGLVGFSNTHHYGMQNKGQLTPCETQEKVYKNIKKWTEPRFRILSKNIPTSFYFLSEKFILGLDKHLEARVYPDILSFLCHLKFLSLFHSTGSFLFHPSTQDITPGIFIHSWVHNCVKLPNICNWIWFILAMF